MLYLTGGNRIGGMETHLIRLARALSPAINPFVVCLNASDDYVNRLSAAAIAHQNVDWQSLLGRRTLKAYREVVQLVDAFSPHIIHSYGFGTDLVAAFIRSTRPHLKLITSRRGQDADTRHQLLRRLTNRWCDSITCVSEETAAFTRQAERARPELLTVIPNGIEISGTTNRERSRVTPDPLRFGTLGTVKPVKGTDLLVDAFLRFGVEHGVELVVAGLIDRPWAKELEERAARGGAGRIRFIGRTTDPVSFLTTLDVFVLPSRSEGMSNALLEAMSLGLPCIATDVGSNRSVLLPPGRDACGIICAPDAQALFDAMIALSGEPDARHRLGAAARSRVASEYSLARMVARYVTLYRRVIAEA